MTCGAASRPAPAGPRGRRRPSNVLLGLRLVTPPWARACRPAQPFTPELPQALLDCPLLGMRAPARARSSSCDRPRTSSSWVSMCPSAWCRMPALASQGPRSRGIRGGSRRGRVSASSSSESCSSDSAEQITQADDLTDPLDVGLRVARGACPASRSPAPRRAGRSPRSSGSSAASCRSARRPRRSAAVARSVGLGAQLGHPGSPRSAAGASSAAHAAAGSAGRGGTGSRRAWAARPTTTAPRIDTAARHHSAVCMLLMNGVSWVVEMWWARPEKTSNRTVFGTDEVTTASTNAIDSTAPVFCTSTRAPDGDAAPVRGDRAHHRGRVRRVEHARADADDEHVHAGRPVGRCRARASSSARARRR